MEKTRIAETNRFAYQRGRDNAIVVKSHNPKEVAHVLTVLSVFSFLIRNSVTIRESLGNYRILLRDPMIWKGTKSLWLELFGFLETFFHFL